MITKKSFFTFILFFGMVIFPVAIAQGIDLQINAATHHDKDLSTSVKPDTALDPKLLFNAVHENSLEKVQSLISSGVDLKVKNEQGESPLMVALRLKEEEIARLLIEKGSQLNIADSDGWTPLMIALSNENTDCAGLMIEKDAEINVLNKNGWSPLMLSIKYSSPENSLLLIKKGAELQIKAQDGESPLLLSAMAGNVGVLAIIMNKVKKTDERDENGNTLLHLAAENGNIEAVALLLKHKVNLEETNHEGLTPLLSALASGQTEAASFLLSKGATHTAIANGNSSLHYAANSGNKECVALLLPGDLPVNIQNFAKETPLHNAGSREVAKYLLTQSADLNASTNDGITPLHKAACNGRQDVIDLLVDRGANINAMATSNGIEEITPLYMAIANSQAAAAIRLIEREANWKTDRKDGMHLFILATSKDLQDIVKLMLAKGQNVNYRNKEGQSAIHYAASKAMLEFLIANGAQLNALDQNNASALHFAVADGRLEVVQALLDKNVDIMQKTKQGYTPLHFVNDPQTAKLLIANGAKLYVKDHNGMTPIEFARYFGKSKDVVSFLAKMEQKQDENVSDVSENKHQVIRLAYSNNVMNSVISDVADENFRSAFTMMASPDISGNVSMAVGLMHSAAITGCPEACYCMGEWTKTGKGIAADEDQAILWYRKAAEMGMATAQFWLGNHLIKDLPNSKSYIPNWHKFFIFSSADDYYSEAYIWLSAAAAQGHCGAKRILDDFSNSMSGAGSIEWEKKAAAQNGQRWGFNCAIGKETVEVKPPLILFYESGGATNANESVYGMLFSKDSSRYVIWHMEISHSRILKDIELPITIVWYDPNGSIFSKQQHKLLLTAGTESTLNDYGCGFGEPGKWDVGSYTVDFFVGKLKIAKVFFTID
ncbi:MAG: ankyrin repeat domain-containing protein [Proteobacteria bacterium]|nr:ankyrin repeat domain-containing protein [Pseudomonadota bacterium]